MKITPIEIRQKAFEKTFRGYDKDEVNAFLLSLSKEWERIQDEGKELKMRLDSSEKEVSKLREVESSLFKTLKTAEDTGANMIEQANKSAELHLKETQMKAEALMNEAQNNAKSIMEQADADARDIVETMQDEVKNLEQVYKELEKYRDNLISELKNLAGDTIERVEKLKKQTNYSGIEAQLKQSKDLSRGVSLKRTLPDSDSTKASETDKIPEVKEGTSSENPGQDGNSSFFDQIR